MAKSHYEEKTLEEMIDGDLINQMNLGFSSRFSTIAYDSRDRTTTESFGVSTR